MMRLTILYQQIQLTSPGLFVCVLFQQFDQGLQDRSLTDFAGIICELAGLTGVGC